MDGRTAISISIISDFLFAVHTQTIHVFHTLSDQPTFLKQPTNVEADIDETVYLYCEVDSNPPSEIIWVFDPIDRV